MNAGMGVREPPLDDQGPSRSKINEAEAPKTTVEASDCV